MIVRLLRGLVLLPYALIVLAVWPAPSPAAPFGVGNLVVVQVGDGSPVTTGTSTAVSLVEFKTSGGAAVQSLTIPTTGSGGNSACTLSANTLHDGTLSRSTGSNSCITLAGYATGTGQTNVAGTTSLAVQRVAAIVDNAGNITTNPLLTAYNQGNIRGAAYNAEANGFYTSGTG